LKTPTNNTNDGMEINKKRFGIDPSTDGNVQVYAEDFRCFAHETPRGARACRKLN
jgi:hypothetical protein